ncbi:RebB family R body protein [Vibrio mexicanus]|uniref:RebB family R body protein n=1 Tax=Vibrio mexicanus TaxID=1004326 RepID=UPI00063CF55F|nr:RebB family R body protein [Vibrio mexicanus]
MADNKIQFENEFEQPVSNDAIESFNTLQSFSNQSTSLLETTLSDTLGLSMHNAVTTQQQSQMTTAASITNACARLLQTQAKPSGIAPVVDEDKPEKAEEPAVAAEQPQPSEEEQPQAKKRFNLMNFLKRKKGGDDE